MPRTSNNATARCSRRDRRATPGSRRDELYFHSDDGMKRNTVSEILHKRPGIKRLHTFRSNVANMTSHKGRILVVLENGKAYRSNRDVTRWYKISPSGL